MIVLTSGSFAQLNDFRGCEGLGSLLVLRVENRSIPPPSDKEINFYPIFLKLDCHNFCHT